MHKLALPVLLSAFVLAGIGCDTTAPTRTQLLPISDLQAYSASSTQVGLTWTASPDAGVADEHHITVTGGVTPLSVSVPIGETGTVIGNLTEGVLYTFSLVVDAHNSSVIDSRPVTIQWSPARRLTIAGTAPIDVFEIGSDSGARSGLQFYDVDTAGPRVLPIDTSGGFQQVLDVLMDTTAAGTLVLESAHLNPLRQGEARQTRFSTFELDAESLDIGQIVPPAATTYTRDSVTIGSGSVSTGKIFYAISHDTNYVRIFVQRHVSSGTLLLGDSPNRRIRVQLSYQGVPGVIFAKPRP